MMKFSDFWSEIEKKGQKGGSCHSQGRGSQVDYSIQAGRLVCKSRGSNKNAKPHKITKETAESYFKKLAEKTMHRFGNKSFRHKHSAWFHDIYASITGDLSR
jgi:hypothetical protein